MKDSISTERLFGGMTGCDSCLLCPTKYMRKLLQQQLISGPRLKIKFQESLQISDERKKKTSILFTWDAIANTHTHPCMHKHTRTCATTYLTPTHAQTHPLTHPLSHAHVQKEKIFFLFFIKSIFCRNWEQEKIQLVAVFAEMWYLTTI